MRSPQSPYACASHLPPERWRPCLKACRDDLRDYLNAIPNSDGQVGAVYAIGDSLVGIEVFDSDATFKKLAGKLLASYALDAMELNQLGEPPAPVRCVPSSNRCAPRRASGQRRSALEKRCGSRPTTSWARLWKSPAAACIWRHFPARLSKMVTEACREPGCRGRARERVGGDAILSEGGMCHLIPIVQDHSDLPILYASHEQSICGRA